MTAPSYDVLIVGSGLAGLAVALHLAPHHRVAVLTKGSMADGASTRAQGGIAAVLDPQDHFDAHVQDTLSAGAGLCDAAATRFVVEHAPRAITWLQALGVPFTREGGALHLTREGGHSARRIVHATDATGAAVQHTLMERVRAAPHVTLLERHVLVDLVTSHQTGHAGVPRCFGLVALDEDRGELRTFSAAHTILATGGAGQVYLHTTNPASATGDGIAAAWRAGCRVSNLEFVQFHPTSLFHPDDRSFLISEAVRGEGGRLLLPAHLGGTRFMPAHDARAELAPRDVVARAIDAEMKRHGLDCVWLDIRHQPADFIRAHFPTIHARCMALGIDMTRQPIPVVPSAHYTCGGVESDLQGRAGLAGLYAIGETACTGLHGANRLASNSLLECLVFARAAADGINRAVQAVPVALPAPSARADTAVDAALVQSHAEMLRRTMWDDVGIVRTDQGLARAARQVNALQQQIEVLCAHSRPTRALLELRNLAQVGALIVRSARARRESRGAHHNVDHPAPSTRAEATTLVDDDCAEPA